MVKKIIAILLVTVSSLAALPNGLAGELIAPDELPSVEAASSSGITLDCASAILVEASTGRVLFEKNPAAPRAIASITKIMTMLLVAEAVEAGKFTLEDIVTTTEHAYSMGGSQIWLEPGEQMTVHEMLKAVAVASANDAATALAEHCSGSEEEFVALMNRRAAELGMTNTVFKNSNGLDEEGHLSCARDVALMSRELLKHELLRGYITIWTDELRGGETFLSNTNKMLKSFTGTTGIKTGTTDDAGVCISASAIRDDMELIAVVLGASSSSARFDDAKKLLTYGFSNFELVALDLSAAEDLRVRVRLGLADYCATEYSMPLFVVVEKGKGELVHCEVTCAETLVAPIVRGEIVGEIAVYCDSELLMSCHILAAASVERLTLKSALRLLFEQLCRM